MNRHELKELIEEGESSTVEFKRKFTSPEKIAKEMCAFANTKGGWLILGVDDNKKVYGVESEKEQMDLVQTAAQFHIEPPLTIFIEVINIEWKEVVVVRVLESSHKPHTVASLPDDERPHERKAYIRHNDESVLASREMMRLLKGLHAHAHPMTLTIGDREKRLFEYLDKESRITTNEFADLVNISKRRAGQILVRLVRADVLQIHTDRQNEYFTLR